MDKMVSLTLKNIDFEFYLDDVKWYSSDDGFYAYDSPSYIEGVAESDKCSYWFCMSINEDNEIEHVEFINPDGTEAQEKLPDFEGILFPVNILF